MIVPLIFVNPAVICQELSVVQFHQRTRGLLIVLNSSDGKRVGMRVNAFVDDRDSSAGGVENICGVVVTVLPQHLAEVQKNLSRWPGVEVVAAEHSKLVLTVEDTAAQSAERTLARLGDGEHVQAVSLIYHHFDSNLEKEVTP